MSRPAGDLGSVSGDPWRRRIWRITWTAQVCAASMLVVLSVGAIHMLLTGNTFLHTSLTYVGVVVSIHIGDRFAGGPWRPPDWFWLFPPGSLIGGDGHSIILA